MGKVFDMFVGKDTSGNPIYEGYLFNYDARQTARSEEAANLYNWNMMEYQNYYNSPEQLLSRMQEAGLNPLFYLGGNAGTTPAASGGNAGGHTMTGRDSRLDQAQAAVDSTTNTLLTSLKQAQDYDIARREQELERRRIMVENKRVNIEEGRLGLEREYQPYRIGETEANITESGSRTRLNGAQVDRLAKENQWTDLQIAESLTKIAEMNKSIDEMTAKIQLYGSQMKLNDALAAYNIAQANYVDDIRWATVEKLQAETGLTTELIKETIAKTGNFIMDTSKKEVEIQVSKNQSVVLQRTAEGIEIKNTFDKTYGGWERVQGIVSGYIHSAAEGVNAAVNVKTGGAAAALSNAKKGMIEESTVKGSNSKIDKLIKALLDLYNDPSTTYDLKKTLTNLIDYLYKLRNGDVNSTSNTVINPTLDF